MSGSGKKKQVRLNIVMSYPVKWTEYSTISNFVQNFYDALGPADFGKKFRYFLDGDTLIITAEKGFAKEWLYYLGASNKRKCDGKALTVALSTSVSNIRRLI